eukprot:TRINITY_DN6756_c1_g1_i1.p1 TRINITY_DN6756_c1_g1~~TRINITY_DN6756_c1_g1_i1.p1  ORF type:complete len:398 (+),score=82.36 TRINITY_DN6756_c1_g1_i1:86-1195(+)
MDDGETFPDPPIHLAVFLNSLKKGLTVRAFDAGIWARAEVIDWTECPVEKAPVQVHFLHDGSDKKKDPWLPLKKLRLCLDLTIDWDAVKAKLPVRQDPESRARRKMLFDMWDTGKKKKLTLDQLEVAIRDLFDTSEIGSDVEELAASVKCAWNLARNLAPSKKKKKTKVSSAKSVGQREFHAFIVAFRHYLECAELFERVDYGAEDDQKLSYRECLKSLETLEAWGIYHDDLKEKFADVDVWTPALKFEDFANWVIARRWRVLDLHLDDSDSEEVVVEQGAFDVRQSVGVRLPGPTSKEEEEKILETFAAWDTDKSGTISEEELLEVFKALGSKISPPKVKMLFAHADGNRDGSVNYQEFCRWLFSGSS